MDDYNELVNVYGNESPFKSPLTDSNKFDEGYIESYSEPNHLGGWKSVLQSLSLPTKIIIGVGLISLLAIPLIIKRDYINKIARERGLI